MGPDVRLRVRLTPRAAADRVDGVVDGELRCRVTASPVDGQANAALVRLLATELRLPRSAIRVVAGASARRKVVTVGPGDLAKAAIAQRWPGLLD